jgi:hypothetical protein
MVGFALHSAAHISAAAAMAHRKRFAEVGMGTRPLHRVQRRAAVVSMKQPFLALATTVSYLRTSPRQCLPR